MIGLLLALPSFEQLLQLDVLFRRTLTKVGRTWLHLALQLNVHTAGKRVFFGNHLPTFWTKARRKYLSSLSDLFLDIIGLAEVQEAVFGGYMRTLLFMLVEVVGTAGTAGTANSRR